MVSLQDFYENTLTGAKYLDILPESIIYEFNQIYHSWFNRSWWTQDMAPPGHMEVVQRDKFYKVFSRKELSHFKATEIIWLNMLCLFPMRTPQKQSVLQYSSR